MTQSLCRMVRKLGEATYIVADSFNEWQLARKSETLGDQRGRSYEYAKEISFKGNGCPVAT